VGSLLAAELEPRLRTAAGASSWQVRFAPVLHAGLFFQAVILLCVGSVLALGSNLGTRSGSGFWLWPAAATADLAPADMLSVVNNRVATGRTLEQHLAPQIWVL
jgi:hypothetical protein